MEPSSPTGQPPFRPSALSLWVGQNYSPGIMTNFTSDVGGLVRNVDRPSLGMDSFASKGDELSSAKGASDSGWIPGTDQRAPSPSLAEHTMNAAAQGNKAKFKEMLEKRRAAVRNTSSAKKQDDDAGKTSEGAVAVAVPSSTIVSAAPAAQANAVLASEAISNVNRVVVDESQKKDNITQHMDLDREHLKNANVTNGWASGVNIDARRDVREPTTASSNHSGNDDASTKTSQNGSNGRTTNIARDDDLIYKQTYSGSSYLDTRVGSTGLIGNQKASNVTSSAAGTAQSRPMVISESVHRNISPPAPPRRQPRLENSMNILRVNYFLIQREKRSMLVSQRYEKVAGDAVRVQARIRELHEQLKVEKQKELSLGEEKLNLQSKLVPMRHAINQRRVVLSSLYSHNLGVKAKIMDEFNEILKNNNGNLHIKDNDDLSLRAREDNTNEYCFSFNFKNRCTYAERDHACPNVHACMHCQQAHPVVLCPSVESLCKGGDVPKPTVHFDIADAQRTESLNDIEMADVELEQDFEDEWIPEREHKVKSDGVAHGSTRTGADVSARLSDRDRNAAVAISERNASTSGPSQHNAKVDARSETQPQPHSRYSGDAPRDHFEPPREHHSQPPRDHHQEPPREQHDPSRDKPGEYSKKDSRPCWNWNRSRCKNSRCQFRHRCSICSGEHRFTACPSRVGADSNDGGGEQDYGMEDRLPQDFRRPYGESAGGREREDDGWSADEIIRRVDPIASPPVAPRSELPPQRDIIPRYDWSSVKRYDHDDGQSPVSRSSSTVPTNWTAQQQIPLQTSQTTQIQTPDQLTRAVSPEEERLRQLREAALSSLRGIGAPPAKSAETVSERVVVKQEPSEPDMSSLRSDYFILHPIPQRPASHHSQLSNPPMPNTVSVISIPPIASMPVGPQSVAPSSMSKAITHMPAKHDIPLALEHGHSISPHISQQQPQQQPQLQQYVYQPSPAPPLSPYLTEPPLAHGYGPPPHSLATPLQPHSPPTMPQPHREFTPGLRGPPVPPLTPQRENFAASPREPLYDRDRDRTWEREHERERSPPRYGVDEGPYYDLHRDERNIHNTSLPPQSDEFRRAPEYDDYRPNAPVEHYPPQQRLPPAPASKDPYYPPSYHQNLGGSNGGNKDYYGGDKNFGTGYDDPAARKRKYDQSYQSGQPYDSRVPPPAGQPHTYMRSPTPSRSGIASYGGNGLSYGPLGGSVGMGRDPRDGRDKRHRWS